MAKIVIIGAGLTGLSAAYHLEKKGFSDYLLFEKESTIGGLCRSVQQDGFTFDFTGHLLHTSDPYFRALLEDIVGLENFNIIQRRSFVYSQDVYTRYPYQINLYGLPTQTIANCIEGFVQRSTHIKQPKTFRDWVLKNFGAGFGKHFFFPYQRKIFAYDINKLSASWTGRFVPSTSLTQIINGALYDNTESIGYNANFLYPKHGGIFAWVEKFAQRIKKPIHTNFCVQTINLQHKTITFTNGHVEPFEQLITTMPLDNLLNHLEDKPTTAFKRARPYLLCNSVVNFNLGIKNKNVSDKHWIYFPQRNYPFYRLGFPHNFADSMAPAGCSSLYGEFAHVNKPASWVKKTLQDALHKTKHVLNINEQDIATECIIHIPHAYVIYDFWREKNLSTLLHRLQEQHVYSVGRYGEWKYASMQEAILDGKKIADTLTIIPARRYHTPSKINQQKRNISHESPHPTSTHPERT
ncbi:MAG TPA: FAD-dependent oxidoreductase [Candidatus Dependentiae bacterium]|nr:FAD-dependent oxidoreductase [Candidatus Dependentiae bacterium]HRQ62657.1 FAD-dependent oxidoreductase [Candidatus Dependentiae bacterium]